MGELFREEETFEQTQARSTDAETAALTLKDRESTRARSRALIAGSNVAEVVTLGDDQNIEDENSGLTLSLPGETFVTRQVTTDRDQELVDREATLADLQGDATTPEITEALHTDMFGDGEGNGGGPLGNGFNPVGGGGGTGNRMLDVLAAGNQINGERAAGRETEGAAIAARQQELDDKKAEEDQSILNIGRPGGGLGGGFGFFGS